jgi:signal transduction histidine kinase/DNA-binding response OmpR family regulator
VVLAPGSRRNRALTHGLCSYDTTDSSADRSPQAIGGVDDRSWSSAPPSAPPSAGIEVLEPEDALGIGVGSDILVVDDDAGNLVAYQAALEPLGRKLVLAQSGMDAVAKLLDQDFALMLLDVAMPSMTGLETARLARQRPRNKGLPIVFITGEASSPALILEAYEIGACDFVVKPIMPDVLRAKARAYLQLQERTRALIQYARKLRESQRRADEAETLLRDREVVEGTARRLKKLQQVTEALADARTPSEVAVAAVRLGAEAVDASAGSIWMATSGGALALAGTHGIPDDYVRPWREIPPDSKLPAMRVLGSGAPLWAEDEADFARLAPEAFEQARAAGRASAFAALPLAIEGRPQGVLVFSYNGQHRFSDEEREFLSALARACEHALERSRLYAVELDARRAAEESTRRAEAANHRKDEFLAMLGHELRNPLAAIVSALDLLKSREGSLSRELTIADRQLSHLTQIVNDLVDVARVTRGTIALRREAVEVARAVADAIELAKPTLAQHAHDLSVAVPADLVVDADRERIVQVLANLLSNAAKYTPGKGRIEVTAKPAGRFVRIDVRDNGVGISEQLMSELFEPFVQGERTPDRALGGLGIGLALVRTVVELHGGRVKAFSEGAGTGATFTIQWPMASNRTRTAESPAVARPPLTTEKLKILVVDDNRDAAELFAALLETVGQEVAVAHDGILAVDVASSFCPHVAFLDIGLPGRDGYALARELRALPSCANTVLVALTGYGQPEDRLRSERAGFAHHYVKPMEMKALAGLLTSIAAELSTMRD